MKQPEQSRGDRRRTLRLVEASPNAVFRRILLAEIAVVITTVAFAFILAYLIFTPGAHATPLAYRAVVYLVALAAVAAVAIVVAAVRVAHRICGPMAKIRAALHELSRGADPGEVAIRKEDDLHELVTALNGAVQEIRRERSETLHAPPVTAEVLALVNAKLIEEAEAEFGGNFGGPGSR